MSSAQLLYYCQVIFHCVGRHYPIGGHVVCFQFLAYKQQRPEISIHMKHLLITCFQVFLKDVPRGRIPSFKYMLSSEIVGLCDNLMCHLCVWGGNK